MYNPAPTHIHLRRLVANGGARAAPAAQAANMAANRDVGDSHPDRVMRGAFAGPEPPGQKPLAPADTCCRLRHCESVTYEHTYQTTVNPLGLSLTQCRPLT